MNQYDEAMISLFRDYLSRSECEPEWFERKAQVLKRFIDNKREAMWLIHQVIEVEDERE